MAVALLPAVVGPGWIELSAAGVSEAAAKGLMLLLGFADGSTVEVALTAGVRGAVTQVLQVDAPVVSASMAAPVPLGRHARATLTRLGRAGLLRRAIARDLEVTGSAVRWRILGKKVRARNLLMRLFGQPRQMAYAAFLERNASVWAAEVSELERWRAGAGTLPRIEVVDGPEAVSALPHEGEGGRSCDWLVILRDGDVLAPDALLRLAKEISATSRAVAVTWDSDMIDEAGRRFAPELKPQWNEALYLARDYVGSFAVSLAAVAEGRAALPSLPLDLPDALLLAAARSEKGVVQHMPRILVQRRVARGAEDASSDEKRRTLVSAYLRHDTPDVTASTMPGGITRVSFPVPDPAPLVSLIVATRDRLDLLEPCISGLLHRTAYPALEVLIADNASSDARTLSYFSVIARDPRVRMISCPGPFNFATINNRAARAARGRVLGFVNNDIEVTHSDWLAEMVGQALRPRVGAVGARLLYPSGLVQHAGVVLGVGGYAGHAHRFAHPGDWGYLGRLQAQQYVAAVTAACLLVEQVKFEAVGGFDGEAFPVAYNDVDLCLRLRAAGYETLWTPYAELLHKESASRATDYSSARHIAYEMECRRLKERWGVLIGDDPHTHPALSRRLENFSLE